MNALELLHPAGVVRRVLLRGEAIPAGLAPGDASRVTSEADLALIAPSHRELRQSGWIERAAREAAGALAKDGFAYAVLPPRARARARTQLRRAGLALETPFAQLPGPDAPRYLVPLRDAPWLYAFGSLIAARPTARRLLLAAHSAPLGIRALAAVLPETGIVARRPGAAALAGWIADFEGSLPETSDVVVAASWRGPGGSVVLHCFAAGRPDPWGVVKVAPGTSPEGDLLVRAGARASQAGAQVPRRLSSGRLGQRSVVVETVVRGRPAADLLARSPTRLHEVAAAVTCWLERWSTASVRTDGSGVERLTNEVLEAADALGPLLPGREGYRRRLSARCAELQEADVPLVARHNDLTMWNVVLDGHGSIGILDWAEAEDVGLPLTDFFYAMADAVAASQNYPRRLRVVQSCFVPASGGAVARYHERLVRAVGVSPEAAKLCFHACWLRHACNEVKAGVVDGAFLEVARWLSGAEATVSR